MEPLRWCKRTCGVYVYTFWKCSTYILPYVYWEPKPSRTKLCILVPIDHPQCAQRIFIETSRALMAHQACQSRCRSQCLNELEASWPAYMQAGMPGKASSILSKLKSRWIFLRQADAMLRRPPRHHRAAGALSVGLPSKLKRLTIDRNGKSFIIFNPF